MASVDNEFSTPVTNSHSEDESEDTTGFRLRLPSPYLSPDIYDEKNLNDDFQPQDLDGLVDPTDIVDPFNLEQAEEMAEAIAEAEAYRGPPSGSLDGSPINLPEAGFPVQFTLKESEYHVMSCFSPSGPSPVEIFGGSMQEAVCDSDPDKHSFNSTTVYTAVSDIMQNVVNQLLSQYPNVDGFTVCFEDTPQTQIFLNQRPFDSFKKEAKTYNLSTDIHSPDPSTFLLCFGYKAYERLLRKIEHSNNYLVAVLHLNDSGAVGKDSGITSRRHPVEGSTTEEKIIYNFAHGVQLIFEDYILPLRHGMDLFSTRQISNGYEPDLENGYDFDITTYMTGLHQNIAKLVDPRKTFFMKANLNKLNEFPNHADTVLPRLLSKDKTTRILTSSAANVLITSIPVGLTSSTPVSVKLVVDQNPYLQIQGFGTPATNFSFSREFVHDWSYLSGLLTSVTGKLCNVFTGFVDASNLFFVDIENSTSDPKEKTKGSRAFKVLTQFFGVGSTILLDGVGQAANKMALFTLRFAEWKHLEDYHPVTQMSPHMIKTAYSSKTILGDKGTKYDYYIVPQNITCLPAVKVLKDKVIIKLLDDESEDTKKKWQMPSFSLILATGRVQDYLLDPAYPGKYERAMDDPSLIKLHNPTYEKLVEGGCSFRVITFPTMGDHREAFKKLTMDFHMRLGTFLTLRKKRKRFPYLLIRSESDPLFMTDLISPRMNLKVLTKVTFFRTSLGGRYHTSQSYAHLREKYTEERLAALFPKSIAWYREGFVRNGHLCYVPETELDVFRGFYLEAHKYYSTETGDFMNALALYMKRTLRTFFYKSDLLFERVMDNLCLTRKYPGTIREDAMAGCYTICLSEDLYEYDDYRQFVVDLRSLHEEQNLTSTRFNFNEFLASLRAHAVIPENVALVSLEYNNSPGDGQRECLMILPEKYSHLATDRIIKMKAVIAKSRKRKLYQ